MADDTEPVYEQDVALAVEETFDRLIEAWEDLAEAEQALESYRSSNSDPQAPSLFEGREQLTGFVLHKKEYDRGLERVTGDRRFAQEQYDKAVNLADGLLPENSSLIYDYRGARGSLQGTRYLVRNRPRIPNYERTGRTAKISVEVQSRP